MEAELLNKSSAWGIVERLHWFLEFNSKTLLQA